MDTQNRFVVIVGKIGNGKSSSGNTLLGKQFFKWKRSLNSVTSAPETHSTVRGANTYMFIDTPGFFDPNVHTTDVLKAVQQSVRLCRHVNAFLLVFNGASRLGEDEVLLPHMLSVAIGQSCLKRIIVLFTHGNEFSSNEDFKEFIRESEVLSNITNACSGIVCKVENRMCPTGEAEDIEAIFDAIEKLSSDPSGPYIYTLDTLLIHEGVFIGAFDNKDEKLEDQLTKANEELKSRLGIHWTDVAFLSTGVIVSLTGVGTLVYGGYIAAPAVIGAASGLITAVGEPSLVATAATAVAGLSIRQRVAFMSTLGGAAMGLFTRGSAAPEKPAEKESETHDEKDRDTSEQIKKH